MSFAATTSISPTEADGSSAGFHPPKRSRRRNGCIPLYICEYHDEALRSLHHAIRCKRMPFGDLTMVHLDAHPDLGASTAMPAEQVFQAPREVHASLRQDPGGIAQWILPAVYGGHLNCVWWVRPAWALQIADGTYDVAVGRARRSEHGRSSLAISHLGSDSLAGSVNKGRAVSSKIPSPQGFSTSLPSSSPSAPRHISGTEHGAAAAIETIQISCAEPYFVEDGIFCPFEDMVAAKSLRLVVGQLPIANEPLPQIVPRIEEDDKYWILDVCLDYFACGNPFLSYVRPEISAPFAAIQNSAKFRQGSVTDVPEFLKGRDGFELAYNKMLKEAIISAECESDSGLGEEEQDLEGDSDAEDPGLENLIAPFLPDTQREALLQNLKIALESAQTLELKQILEAGDMVTLPLHPVVDSEVEERLAAFEVFLRRLCRADGDGFRTLPCLVTVARSVVDGFCPMRWHLRLEQGVLDIVERCLGQLDIRYSDELDLLETRLDTR